MSIYEQKYLQVGTMTKKSKPSKGREEGLRGRCQQNKKRHCMTYERLPSERNLKRTTTTTSWETSAHPATSTENLSTHCTGGTIQLRTTATPVPTRQQTRTPSKIGPKTSPVTKSTNLEGTQHRHQQQTNESTNSKQPPNKLAYPTTQRQYETSKSNTKIIRISLQPWKKSWQRTVIDLKGCPTEWSGSGQKKKQ